MKANYILQFLFLYLPMLAFSQYPSSGLLAKYEFTGNANDDSGNGYHGTVYGATLVNDRFGNLDAAYSFTSGDYIELSGTSGLDLYTGFSLVAWVYSSSNVDGSSVISKHENYYENGYNLVFSFHQAGCNIEPDAYNALSADLYNDGNWHLFVGTFDGSTVSIYADKDLKDSKSATYVTGNSMNILIGKDSDISLYDGLIDDVAIYDRALTEEEICDIFEIGGWTLGTGSVPERQLVKLYPNPADQDVNIVRQNSGSEQLEITISDALGKEVMSTKLNGSVLNLRIDSLVSGLYFIEIFEPQSKIRSIEKLLKQ